MLLRASAQVGKDSNAEASHGSLQRSFLKSRLKSFLKSVSSVHRPSDLPDVFIFAMPRGGSTWLMELICEQPGFTFCTEPLNLRQALVRRYLDISSWHELYADSSLPKLGNYLGKCANGSLKFRGPAPFSRYYRPLTRRVVFKIIHGAEDRIAWCIEKFGCRVVLLLRHPIAVALSREYCPRLEAFIESDYQRHFTQQQLKEARRILTSGSTLEQGVLSWCFQNSVPLKEMTKDWAVVSYEQLIIEPQISFDYLAKKLILPFPERMSRGVLRPSRVAAKSDRETQELVVNYQHRTKLVDKWRKQVNEKEEHRAMEILNLFDITAYRAGSTLPTSSFWLEGSADSDDKKYA